MSRRTANLIGWGLIAAVTAICFGLNALRAQYIYFNWFIIFTLVASAVLVLTHLYLARRVDDRADADQSSDSLES